MHLFETVIRLGHTDAAAVVFFPRYLDLAHLAFEDLLDALGHPLQAELHAAPVGYPIVHLEADYHRPLRMGDRVAIEVDVLRVGTSSFTLRHRIGARGPAGPAATVTIVHAAADVPSKSSRPLPAELALALQAHLVEPA